LVFHHENGKKNGKIRGVFLEYKYRSDRNPIDQIKKYYQILKGRGRTANYLKLEKKYKEKFPKTNTE
jgi:hypothetical protein